MTSDTRMVVLAAETGQNPPVVPAPNDNVLDWGIAIAVLVFLLREGLHFFKSKDQQESALTATLIDDQRQTNRELRQYLEVQQIGQIKISDALSQMEQRLARHSTELLVDNREKLAKLYDMLDALHRRLDQIEQRSKQNESR